MYRGVTDGRLVLLGCIKVRTDVKEITVKVRITSVLQVRMVRPFRFRMLEIPKLKAAAEADKRPTSALYTFDPSCLIFSTCSSNFRTMILITIAVNASTTNAIRMIIGVVVIWNAGCTCAKKKNTTRKIAAVPTICFWTVGNANNNRSIK